MYKNRLQFNILSSLLILLDTLGEDIINDQNLLNDGDFIRLLSTLLSNLPQSPQAEDSPLIGEFKQMFDIWQTTLCGEKQDNT